MIWDDNADMVVRHTDGSRRGVQDALDALREERRPYVVLTPHMQVTELQCMLVPVSMLEEEVYKAEICTYLARKTGAKIILLQARDYGSKAARNVQRMVTHFRSVTERTGEQIDFEMVQGAKDSFSLMHEAADILRPKSHSQVPEAQLLLLTASREYGLDDWLFGPQELKAVLRSPVPVMLVNPRSDLFSLCD